MHIRLYSRSSYNAYIIIDHAVFADDDIGILVLNNILKGYSVGLACNEDLLCLAVTLLLIITLYLAYDLLIYSSDKLEFRMSGIESLQEIDAQMNDRPHFLRGFNSFRQSLDAVAVIPSTSSFVLAADKKWFRIDLVPNESEPECENQGSYGSKTFLNKITLVLPGTGKKVTGLISQLNNDDVVIIVPMADGKCRLFGSPAYQAELSLKQAYGKAATDANTTTIEVSVTDEFAAPFYEGNIVTAYGTINGATDELVTT